MKILIINLMHLGDLMLMTPILPLIRKEYEGAEIDLLVDRKLKDLVSENPNIDRLLTLDKKGVDNKPLNFLRFIEQIRKMKFDLVINCHRNERASSIAAFSGAKHIVGYSKPFFSLFFESVINNEAVAHHIGSGPFGLFGEKKYKPGWVHQVASYTDILTKCLKVKVETSEGLFMKPHKKAIENIEKLYKDKFDPNKKTVALNVGASWETKRWIFSYFAEVADALIAEGFTIAFLGGDMDRGFVRETVSCMKTDKATQEKSVVTLTGKLTLAEVAAFLAKTSLFITTDSGPMHIGVAANVPIVTMFGASPVPGFYPYTDKAVLIAAKTPCHPCGEHTCPKQEENFACMKNITADEVLNAAHYLLEKFEGRPAETLPPPKSFEPEFR